MKQEATMKIKPDMRYFMSRTLPIFSVGMLYVASVHADSVNDMCKKTDEVCSCAANQLKSEVGDEKYGLYEAIGAVYIANKSSGMNMGDAWDAAVKGEAGKRGKGFTETLNLTNEIGKTHRKAIKDCAG